MPVHLHKVGPWAETIMLTHSDSLPHCGRSQSSETSDAGVVAVRSDYPFVRNGIGTKIDRAVIHRMDAGRPPHDDADIRRALDQHTMENGTADSETRRRRESSLGQQSVSTERIPENGTAS